MEWVTDKGLIGGIDSLKEKRNHRFFKKKKIPSPNQSLFLFFIIIYFMCMGVLQAWYPGRAEEGIGSHGTGISGELQCGCWELNL